VGDIVKVKRAGEVIPYVIGPVTEERTGIEIRYIPPEKCPVCGTQVEKPADEVAWYCVNSACPEQLIRNIEHFVSKPAMDIAGLGIKIVTQLIEAGLVSDVADLYYLKSEELLNLDGFAEKKAENLIESIRNSKSQSLARLINGLGIRGVGEVVAGDLASSFGDLHNLSEVDQEEIENIAGIGPNIAAAIVDWFSQKSNQAVLEKLRKAGVWPTQIRTEAEEKRDLPLGGITFVITGTLPNMKRKEAKEFIEKNGGKVTGSISSKTNYLLAGESPGSKLSKAVDLGIKVIDETGLQNLAGLKSNNYP
jgi:DNA ligase (NAD+)